MSNHQDLHKTITHLYELSIAVKDNLKNEQEALIKRDVGRITSSCQLKLNSILKLNKQIDHTNLVLSQLGYDRQSSIIQFLKDRQVDARSLDVWNKCQSTINDCEQINRDNSTLVSTGIQHTVHALNFLTQSIHGEPSHQYDKSGIRSDGLSYGMNLKA